MKMKREVFIDKWKPILQQVKEIIQERLDSVYKAGLGMSFKAYNLMMFRKNNKQRNKT